MTYGDRLREYMKAQEPPLSVRALGRKLNPAKPEQGRRTLQRILAEPTEPRAATKARIAAALHIERRQLEGEDTVVEALFARLLLLRQAEQRTERQLEQLLFERKERACAPRH